MNKSHNAAPTAPVAPAADTADKVTRLRRALYQIAHWPDGGNACGQEKIKRFAIRILDGDPPTVAPAAVAPNEDARLGAFVRALATQLSDSPKSFLANVQRAISDLDGTTATPQKLAENAQEVARDERYEVAASLIANSLLGQATKEDVQEVEVILRERFPDVTALPDERAALFNQIADALYQPASADERTAFEAWGITQDINLTRGMPRERDYSYMEADYAWRIWRGVWAVLQARAAPQASLMDDALTAARAAVREELDSASVHPCDEHNDEVRSHQLSDHMRTLYRSLLAAQGGDQ